MKKLAIIFAAIAILPSLATAQGLSASGQSVFVPFAQGGDYTLHIADIGAATSSETSFDESHPIALPEPATLALLGLGYLMTLPMRKRK